MKHQRIDQTLDYIEGLIRVEGYQFKQDGYWWQKTTSQYPVPPPTGSGVVFKNDHFWAYRNTIKMGSFDTFSRAKEWYEKMYKETLP